MSTTKIKSSTEMQAELAKIGVNLKLENPNDEMIVVRTYTKLIIGFDPEEGIIKIEIKKNGEKIKVMVAREHNFERQLHLAHNYAGGLWNGKDTFTVTSSKN